MRSHLRNPALPIAMLALVLSFTGWADAARKAVVSKLGGAKPGSVIRLDKKGKIPLRAIPVVKISRNALKLNGATRSKLTVGCPIPNAIDFGTWCLESSTYPVPPEQAGQNDYAYAAQKCVSEGGWLPTAAQLIGAAPRAKLQSTIDDSPTSSGADEFPDAKNGIKDRREMSSDLTTTMAGGSAAGSQGVSVGSKGNQNLGEPDPVPEPADPMPTTLNYVTVYDNHNQGGFAGGAAVGKPESFRCAYAKGSQGVKFDR